MKSSSCGVRLLFISSLTIGNGKVGSGFMLSIAESGEFCGSQPLHIGQISAKSSLLNRECSISAGAIVQRIEQAFPKR